MSLQQQTYAFFLIARQQNHEMEAPFQPPELLLCKLRIFSFDRKPQYRKGNNTDTND